MGYTHYWKSTDVAPDSEAYGRTLVDAKRIIDFAREKHGVVIVRDYNEPGSEPELTEGHIWLNGEGEDGHETFFIEAGPLKPFDFCKTAEKPYDAVVTAILIRAKVHYGDAIEVSSDGSWDEWAQGQLLVAGALGTPAVCPFTEDVPSEV